MLGRKYCEERNCPHLIKDPPLGPKTRKMVCDLSGPKRGKRPHHFQPGHMSVCPLTTAKLWRQGPIKGVNKRGR